MPNMRYSIHIFALFLLLNSISCCLYCQTQPQKDTTRIPPIRSSITQLLPNLTPQAPNTAAFGRYGQYPVNLSTGLVEISVPIYEISAGKLKVPIMLQYHAAGHKVTDRASWVGLGWSLSAGGQITRNVIGIEDELDYLPNGLPDFSTFGFCDLRTELNKYTNGNRDEGADIFSYQLSQNSGRFILPSLNNPSQEVYVLPDEKIRVTYTRNGLYSPITSFTLTDIDGTRYTFAAPEFSSTNGSFNGMASNFLLTEIQGTQPTEKIVFSYASQPVFSSNTDVAHTQAITDEGVNSLEVNAEVAANINASFESKRLTAIYFPNGKITFEGEQANRQDLPTAALDRIRLYSFQPSTNDYTLVKSFDLVQDYFDNGNTQFAYDGNKRLRLNQVRLLANDDTQIGQYTLLYNTSTHLPSYLSKARDFWGYFNGQNTNTSLLPQQSVSYALNNGGSGTVTVGSANRNPDEPSMKAWSLTQITYPTGGFTSFEWEANRYLDPNNNLQIAGGLRVKTLKEYQSPTAVPIIKSYIYGTNESGAGIAGFNTLFRFESATRYIWYNTPPDNTPTRKRTRTFVSNFNANLTPYEATPVLYDFVTEHHGSPTTNIGKTTYEFKLRTDVLDYPNQTFASSYGGCSSNPIFPTPDLTNKQWLLSYHWDRGQLLKKTIWGNDGRKKSQQVNTYTALKDTQTAPIGLNVYQLIDFSGLSGGVDEATCACNLRDGEYIYRPYRPAWGMSKLTRTEEYHYDDTDEAKYVYLKTETDYNANFLPKETRTLNSDGDWRIERTRYVTDLNPLSPTADGETTALVLMLLNHQISTPIEILSLRKNPADAEARIIGGQLNTFKYFSNNFFYNPPYNSRVVPEGIFLLEIPASPAVYESDFTLAHIQDNGSNGTFVKDSRYSQRIDFGEYDLYGNLSDYRLNGGASNFYTHITPQSNGTFHPLVTSEVRNSGGFNTYSTFFGYELPLLGLKKLTALNQLETHFEYDNFGRLKRTKDHNGHITQEYDYNYTSGNNGGANFVKTHTPRTLMGALTGDHNSYQTSTNYFDGLGRSLQNVAYKAGFNAANDIVTNATVYDNFDRLTHTYIPFPNGGNGALASLPGSVHGDSSPFSETTQFDNSSLNRPKKAFGAGQAWRNADKATQKQYLVANNEEVRRYYLTTNGVYIGAAWEGQSLFKNVTLDEQGHSTIEYTDNQGKLIQKSVQADANEYLHTHYVYDAFDRLKYVIQPKAFANPANFVEGSTYFNEGVFGYRYDKRGRVAERHVPAGGWTYTVYDRLDRQVLQQTELQRPDNKWNFQKYDAIGRRLLSGELTNTNARQTLQDDFDGVLYAFEERFLSGFYTTQSYPNAVTYTDTEVRLINHYDEYWYWPSAGFEAANAYHAQHPTATGQQTGAQVRNAQNQDWLYTTLYYDTKGRPIQTFQQNLYNQTERTDTEYNFAGEVLKMREIKRNQAGIATTKLKTYTYDHVGRKTTCQLDLGNINNQTIANYEYDEVGRMKRKVFLPNGTFTVGGTPASIVRPPNPSANTQDIATQFICLQPGTLIDAQTLNTYTAQIGTGGGGSTISGLQTIDYQYHIRDWLRGINSPQTPSGGLNTTEGDLFGYELEYETAGFFDGNIGKQTWQRSQDNLLRSYTYNYDKSSRLKSAIYTGPNNEDFSLSNLNYDQNGNITNLQRKGNVGANFGDIDNLTYYYNGNRLTGITDATSNTDGFKEATSGGTGAYTYWPDGSLKSDANKGISQIDYDTFLQRVSQVTFSNGSWIKWSYDGAGTLLKRQLSNGDVWDYADDALYKNGVLYQFNDEEGRITLNNGTYNYEFEYRDHQNNLRVGFKAENGQLVQTQTSETDAFGFEISSLSSTGAGLQNYRFQKQEKIDDFGLNISWFKYRPADPTIGRMWQVDRLAEEYRHNSVYAFSENKVTAHIELDGLEGIYVFSKQKQEYPGLEKSLNILAKSGIMKELVNEFSKDNNKTDIYINVTNQTTADGDTRYYENQDNTKQATGETLTRLGDNNPNLRGAKEKNAIRENTFSEGQAAIIIRLNEFDVKKAAGNRKAQNMLSSTITHEIKAHGIDLKDGKDNISAGKEHQKYYNIPGLLSISPKYDEIKPDSPAGQYKKRIEATKIN